jgi:hypothetical protein
MISMDCIGSKFMVLNKEDIENYLTKEQKKNLENITQTIQNKREINGKSVDNSYVVVNMDEEYSQEIIDILNANNNN